MKLTDILAPECVRKPLLAADKIEAIRELVEVLADTGKLLDPAQVLRAVLDRENTLSTGIGDGLAVPHGKCAGCSHLVMAVGRTTTPIDFASRDGQPVELIVLLVSPPDETGPHIQALARIARLMLMPEFREAVLGAATAREIYDTIAAFER